MITYPAHTMLVVSVRFSGVLGGEKERQQQSFSFFASFFLFVDKVNKVDNS